MVSCSDADFCPVPQHSLGFLCSTGGAPPPALLLPLLLPVPVSLPLSSDICKNLLEWESGPGARSAPLCLPHSGGHLRRTLHEVEHALK